jgi:hypothetical protein
VNSIFGSKEIKTPAHASGIEYAELRDRKKITFTVCQGKSHSSLDDFFLQRETRPSAAEKSSRSEQLFP